MGHKNLATGHITHDGASKKRLFFTKNYKLFLKHTVAINVNTLN